MYIKMPNIQCSKNVPTLACYNSDMHKPILIMLLTKYAIKRYFPSHLTSASALPCETGNPEIASQLKCCMQLCQ